MERYDQHVHTRFSFDGKMDVDEACEEAVHQGLDGLTFTEHFSMDELDPSYHFLRYDAYRAAVEHARETYDGRLAIGFGLEISEPHIEKCRAALAEARQTMTLDFVIGSVHNIGSVKLRLFMESKTQDEAVAVRPLRILRVVSHVVRPELIRHRRRAEREARVAGVRLLDRIRREHADGVDAFRIDVCQDISLLLLMKRILMSLFYRTTATMSSIPAHLVV